MPNPVASRHNRESSPVTKHTLKQRRLKTVTTINGDFVPESRALISVFDNSLLYAEGLFETLLAYGDRILYLDEHLARLYAGAEVIGLKMPASRRKLVLWMRQTLKRHPDYLKKLRLTVTSGESARWTGVNGKPQVILSAAPHEFPDRPARLLVSQFRVDHRSVFRQVKTISYAINAAALKRARDAGCDDAILVNERGLVAEVTSANIYWVKGRKIYTPPLSAGCLGGVTRTVALRDSAAIGVNITERTATVPSMLNADEIFITSSTRLVQGVALIKYDGRSHRFSAGPVTRQISDHFKSAQGD
jgi:branched-chain amino acid aminotransferase